MPTDQTTCKRAAPAGLRVALRDHLARFRAEDRGGMVIFSLFIFVAMMMVAGLAIDFMRYEMTRTQFQNTVDRAVLAAASLEQKQDPEAVVKDYFLKAGLGDFLGPVDVQETESSGTVSFRRVSALTGATLSPIFLSYVGMDEMPITAYSVAEEGISDLEISLVLDVSGSMGNKSSSGYSKVYELREAAKDFTYHMQCNPNASRNSGEACSVEDGKVSISIVPYAEQVTVGKTLLDQFNVTQEHAASHCVTFDEDEFTSAAIDPTVLIKRTGHFDYNNSASRSPSSFVCLTDKWREIKPLMYDYHDVYDAIDALRASGWTSIDLGMKWGAALLDPAAQSVVTALTSTAVAPGSTETVVNTAFDGRPYDYDQAYNMKVVILMTDGENTYQHYLKDAYRDGPSVVWHYRKADGSLGDDVYSVYNASRNQYRWVDEDGDDFNSNWQDDVYIGEASQTCGYEQVRYRTWWGTYYRTEWVCNPTGAPDGVAYQLTYPEVWAKFTTRWFSDFWWLEDPQTDYDQSDKDDHLADICAAAKSEDILVYTIGFEIGEGSHSESVMKSCATTRNHYFPADGVNLGDVFSAIASSINQLRLTE